jgi:hypothetical protein
MLNNKAGYNIIQASKTEWYFQIVGHVAYVGTLREVIVYAVKNYYFDIKEIDRALQDMIKTNKSAVHFGMYNTFIYSFDQDFTPIRKAS